MKVLGAARVQRRLDLLPATAQRLIGDALEAGAASLHSHAVRKIQRNSGSGRVYTRRGVSHTASAPGEYPNTDTGAMVASMGWRSTSALSSIFYAGVVYAKYLEFGTSRMAARPFMRPTLRALRSEIRGRVDQAIRAAMRVAANG